MVRSRQQRPTAAIKLCQEKLLNRSFPKRGTSYSTSERLAAESLPRSRAISYLTFCPSSPLVKSTPADLYEDHSALPRASMSLSGKSGVTFYLWCTGCRIPLHPCLFTGRLTFGSRCGVANCENETQDHHKAFHGANSSIVVEAEAQPNTLQGDSKYSMFYRLSSFLDRYGSPSDETFSCGQSSCMKMPYETVSTITAGTSHGLVSCAPYPPIVDSKSQTIGRRYNPEMIQIRKLPDWMLSERRFGF